MEASEPGILALFHRFHAPSQNLDYPYQGINGEKWEFVPGAAKTLGLGGPGATKEEKYQRIYPLLFSYHCGRRLTTDPV